MNNEIKEINLSEMLFNRDERLLDYITNLQQLCNKYEEEHNTTFQEWQKDIQENERLKEANKILEENWEHYMMICGQASEKSQELKDSIDKSNFDGMTKTILILGINQIQNILQNGSDDNE